MISGFGILMMGWSCVPFFGCRCPGKTLPTVRWLIAIERERFGWSLTQLAVFRLVAECGGDGMRGGGRGGCGAGGDGDLPFRLQRGVET